MSPGAWKKLQEVLLSGTYTQLNAAPDARDRGRSLELVFIGLSHRSRACEKSVGVGRPLVALPAHQRQRPKGGATRTSHPTWLARLPLVHWSSPESTATRITTSDNQWYPRARSGSQRWPRLPALRPKYWWTRANVVQLRTSMQNVAIQPSTLAVRSILTSCWIYSWIRARPSTTGKPLTGVNGWWLVAARRTSLLTQVEYGRPVSLGYESKGIIEFSVPK